MPSKPKIDSVDGRSRRKLPIPSKPASDTNYGWAPHEGLTERSEERRVATCRIYLIHLQPQNKHNLWFDSLIDYIFNSWFTSLIYSILNSNTFCDIITHIHNKVSIFFYKTRFEILSLFIQRKINLVKNITKVWICNVLTWNILICLTKTPQLEDKTSLLIYFKFNCYTKVNNQFMAHKEDWGTRVI